MKKRFVLIPILLGIIVLSGCVSNTIENKKPTVVVSILPLKYIVEQIVDSTVQVKVLVPPGSSPEMYEPTPEQLIDFSKADAYFAIGLLDFEIGLQPKLKDDYKIRFVNLSDSCNLIKGEDDHDMESGIEDGHHHHAIDPHVWMSPVEVKHMAGEILSTLISLYPDRKDIFEKNYSNFIAHVDSVNIHVKEILEQSNSKAFLIYHSALSYFARDYGLLQLSIENEGKNPSVQGIIDIVKKSRELGIKSVLSQSQFDIHNAQSIAKELGVDVVKVDPLAENWAESMVQIANAVAGSK